MVASFPRRLARLVLAGALVAVLGAASAPPAPAAPSCAYVTGGRATFHDNGQQQLTINVNQFALPTLQVRLSNGQTLDVSSDPNTTYSTNGAGQFFGTSATFFSYLASPQDANKTFPIYAKYFDPCKGVTWTFTMSLHVIPPP